MKKFGRTSQNLGNSVLLNRHKTTQRNNEKNPSFIYCWTTLIIFTANLKLTQKTSIRQTNSKLNAHLVFQTEFRNIISPNVNVLQHSIFVYCLQCTVPES
jgi:hypothetical protein